VRCAEPHCHNARVGTRGAIPLISSRSHGAPARPTYYCEPYVASSQAG
jgi:hypothetical protein